MRVGIGAILVCAALRGERLPLQTLTTAQGLASNTIKKIVRDSRGFIWFCTGQGLSRFDGYQFANFGQAKRLPGRVAWDLTETRSGDYWVATSGGLARLSSASGRRLEVLYPGDDTHSRSVLAVREASGGGLWVGTERGLYRMTEGAGHLEKVDTGPLPESWSEPAVAVLEEDGAGNLWFGGYAGIGRIRKDGHVDRWTPRQGFASYVVVSLYRDRDGSMWAGTERGLCHMRNDPQPGKPPAERCYGREEGLPNPYTQAILRTAAGKLWVGTLEGAAYALPEGAGPLRFTSVTTKQGLSDNSIEALAEDGQGNLWLGASDDGAMKLSAESIVLFSETDGLADPNVIALFEDQSGRLHAVTRSNSELGIHRFTGGKFAKIAVSFPDRVHAFGRGFQQVALQDRSGEWWLATGDGLLRYHAGGSGALRKPPAIHTRPNGPDGANVFRLYEDSRGDIWWSTSSRIVNTLGRWDHARGKMEFFTEAQGLPPPGGVNPASAFVEDKDGVLWVAFEREGLARWRRGGAFEYFDPKKGWPGGRIRIAYRDRNGRLWFGSAAGLWRLDDPRAARPTFRGYTPAEGLSSLVVHSITEDLQGRIYAGTENGVDRLDPDSGRIEHFSTADGLPGGIIQAAYTDRNGNLWFAARHGIARFIPQPAATRSIPLAALITAMKVKGIERPVSAAGESNLAGLALGAGENQIEFTFAAPQSHNSSDLLYQYRLEGIQSSDWTPLANTRSVNFASLPPGSYRFQVRAVGAEAAMATFRILPPFWATWWFRSSAALIASFFVYAFYRYRIRQVLEREHLRMRIATDLHDDIGSSLSRIAIWSEVAAQEAGRSGSTLIRPLAQIGDVSREMIDSMSDIVWAVNPKYDRFTDLASRMRRYASDLAAASLQISFAVSGEDREAPVGPAARREVFLVFKEALNNVLRHARCTECSAALSLNSGWITLEVIDNGGGIDPNTRNTGHGLDSMARRAMRLGGTLRIDSSPGRGTRIEMRVPRSVHERTNRVKSLHT